MKVVHIFTCPPVLVFSKQANVHCIFSPIVSRSGMVLFFVAVRVRFMLQSRVFEGHREKCLGLSTAVSSEGSYDHIWFVVLRRIYIVTKSE